MRDWKMHHRPKWRDGKCRTKQLWKSNAHTHICHVTYNARFPFPHFPVPHFQRLRLYICTATAVLPPIPCHSLTDITHINFTFQERQQRTERRRQTECRRKLDTERRAHVYPRPLHTLNFLTLWPQNLSVDRWKVMRNHHQCIYIAASVSSSSSSWRLAFSRSLGQGRLVWSLRDRFYRKHHTRELKGVGLV